jgi:anti-anti-sigma factor
MVQFKVEKIGNIVILHVKGILYMENIRSAESVWTEQIAQNPEVIAINCKHLNQIDSTAIGTLVKFFNSAMTRDIRLIFFDLNSSIQRLFETAKLHRFFSVTTKKKFENNFLKDSFSNN